MSKKLDQSSRETLAALRDAFPKAFPADGDKPKPLAINTRDSLSAWAEGRPGLSQGLIKKALQRYCAALRYKIELLEPGAMRIDLQGNPVEPVSEEAREHARRYIEEAKAAKKARAERQKERAESQKIREAKERAEKEARDKAKAEKDARKAAQAKVEQKAATKKPVLPARKKPTGAGPVVVVKKKRRAGAF